jgi:heptosyltransferase I
MARAIDIPVVGLYGYTNPRRTGPYRKYTELVVDGFALGPDDDYGVSAPYRPEGMKRVTEQAVLSKVELARRLYPRQRQAGSA